MAITQAQLDALKTTLRAKFNSGLALTPDDWRKVAGYIKSDSKSNTYAWLSQFPAFREWVGSRLHKQLSEKAYNVVNHRRAAHGYGRRLAGSLRLHRRGPWPGR